MKLIDQAPRGIHWVYITLIVVSYFEVKELSGKITVANFVINVLGNITVQKEVVFTGWGLTAIWAMLERVLRTKKVPWLSRRVKELEHRLDPNRTSSGLTETGQTNKEDK